MKTYALSALGLIALICMPCAISARVASPALAALSREADLIVLARVERISVESPDVSIASSRVIEVWKGEQKLSGATVTFTASSSLACDMSTATVGRLSVLFLERDPNRKTMMIAASGRGQMLINEVDGKSYAYLVGVVLPKELEALDKLNPRELGKGILALEDLKEYVLRSLKKRR